MLDKIKMLLEYYGELGFERVPLNCVAGFPAETHVSDVECEAPCQATERDAALKDLRAFIGDCRRCKLSHDRTNIVFGEGSVNARIMFVGEGPGREEDVQARPFVGDAGKLLTRLIEKMSFKREDVYIANIVKCRPPMNRDPREDEIATCFPFLQKQIEIISPQVIVSLGKVAAFTLMGLSGPMTGFSITKIRGKFSDYKGIPLMPTFHPAYLLRNPRDKWLTWEDAQAVLKKLESTGNSV
ncbi:MAG: uracil-DNA glycosylase [Nitrospirae bacterium]|nr:uracil-DNA glycosylase [Nitrospirota bacterium]